MRRIEQILADNKLWFSSPASFNDPFDCKVGPLGAYDPAFLKALIANRAATGVMPSAAEARLAEGDAGAYVEVAAQLQQRVDQCGILSLCEDRDNILLWSHYADMHRGICLEFATEKWPALKNYVLPVIYSHQRPSTNFTQGWDKRRFFQDIALTKHKSWCYEREWRCIELKGKGLVNFPAAALTSVVFGCQVPCDRYQAVMGYIRRRIQRPATYRARMCQREFALVIEQLE
jgi:hypothetical protein